MRIGILGDIHSNLEALEAVVQAMSAEGVDQWVQVGDIIGYGAQPSECIDLVQKLGCIICRGNHDAAVAGLLSTDYFNPYARQALEWTWERLSPDELQFLRNLPLVVERPEFTVVHGSLHMPEQFGYVISVVEAMDSLDLQRTKLGFVGHSHVPAIYLDRNQDEDLEVIYSPEVTTSVRDCRKVLMNVGSVGQPRDEDPRAAYAIYDVARQEVSIKRVAYDIAAAQRKIRAAGLPEVLADRLALGV